MKTIDVYLERKINLVETYNKSIVSSALIEYIISKVINITSKDELKLKLYVTKETIGCTTILKKGLEEEYLKSIKTRNAINIKQILLLLIGLIILFSSTLISDTNILHEVIIIAGWVPIWEAIELELLTDTKEKRRRKIIKKLLHSDMDEIITE